MEEEALERLKTQSVQEGQDSYQKASTIYGESLSSWMAYTGI